MKFRAAAAVGARPQGHAEQGDADEMLSRSMDSKRGPMRTKLGSPAGQGSESGNPSDVPVLSENRAVDLSENRVASPPRSCRTKCATRAMPSRSMDSKRCPMSTKLGSPAGQGSESGNPSNVPVLSAKREWRVGQKTARTATTRACTALCVRYNTTLSNLRIHRSAGQN